MRDYLDTHNSNGSITKRGPTPLRRAGGSWTGAGAPRGTGGSCPQGAGSGGEEDGMKRQGRRK